MGVNTYCKEVMAANFGGSGITGPGFIGLGSGSGTFLVSQTGLVAEISSRGGVSKDLSTSQQAIYTVDFTSTVLSGLSVQEFAAFAASTGGKSFNREPLSAPIVFDGSSEVQIELRFVTF